MFLLPAENSCIPNFLPAKKGKILIDLETFILLQYMNLKQVIEVIEISYWLLISIIKV